MGFDKELAVNLEAVPDEFFCAVCFDIMEDPLQTICECLRMNISAIIELINIILKHVN